MSVIESCSLKTFSERYSIKKAAFICSVNYMKMWWMIEKNEPIRIIQSNETYNVWKDGKLFNTIKESTLKRRGLSR